MRSPLAAAGAARQYSGTVGGIALCQVAVTVTYATSCGHALIGQALYLPGACADDEEHRELAGPKPFGAVEPPGDRRPARWWCNVQQAGAQAPCPQHDGRSGVLPDGYNRHVLHHLDTGLVTPRISLPPTCRKRRSQRHRRRP